MLIAGLPDESATRRAVHGDAVRWTLTDHLLAVVADRLAIMSWQLGGDKHAPRPKPIVRPGVDDGTRRYGRATRPARDVVAYLRRYAPKRGEEVTIDG